MYPFKQASRLIIGSATVMALLLIGALVQVAAQAGMLEFTGALTF